MAFIRGWSKYELAQSVYNQVATATGQITSNATLLYAIICTHGGTASGATIELFDGGTAGTKRLHIESASADRSPFGLSLTRPILFESEMTLAFTATGANVTLGYYNYSV